MGAFGNFWVLSGCARLYQGAFGVHVRVMMSPSPPLALSRGEDDTNVVVVSGFVYGVHARML